MEEHVNEQTNSFMGRIIANKEFVVWISGGMTFLYQIVQYMYNTMYQSQCEEYYNIPGKYFHSSINNKLLYLGCLLLLIGACIYPVVMKRHDEKKGTLTKGSLFYWALIAAVIGMEMGLLNVSNLIEIMNETFETNAFFKSVNTFLCKYATFTFWGVIVLGSFALCGIIFIDKIKSIKAKFIQRVVYFLEISSIVLSLVLMVYGTIFKLSVTIEDKRKYEFVTIHVLIVK